MDITSFHRELVNFPIPLIDPNPVWYRYSLDLYKGTIGLYLMNHRIGSGSYKNAVPGEFHSGIEIPAGCFCNAATQGKVLSRIDTSQIYIFRDKQGERIICTHQLFKDEILLIRILEYSIQVFVDLQTDVSAASLA